MNEFRKYLMSYGSGNMNADMASQHAGRVRKMLYFLDEQITVDSLSGAAVRLGEEWLRNFSRTPSTKKAYLNSFDHFLKYVERENLEGLSKRDLEVLRHDRLGWLKSLRRESQDHRSTRHAQEQGRHILCYDNPSMKRTHIMQYSYLYNVSTLANLFTRTKPTDIVYLGKC